MDWFFIYWSLLPINLSKLIGNSWSHVKHVVYIEEPYSKPALYCANVKFYENSTLIYSALVTRQVQGPNTISESWGSWWKSFSIISRYAHQMEDYLISLILKRHLVMTFWLPIVKHYNENNEILPRPSLPNTITESLWKAVILPY